MNDFEQDRARMKQGHEETKREMARSSRRIENVILAVCVVVIGVVLFGCWCVYHVLKAKHYVP